MGHSTCSLYGGYESDNWLYMQAFDAANETISKDSNFFDFSCQLQVIMSLVEKLSSSRRISNYVRKVAIQVRKIFWDQKTKQLAIPRCPLQLVRRVYSLHSIYTASFSLRPFCIYILYYSITLKIPPNHHHVRKLVQRQWCACLHLDSESDNVIHYIIVHVRCTVHQLGNAHPQVYDLFLPSRN